MNNKFLIFIIISVGLICYSYSAGGKFIWDDNYFVVENTSIHTILNARSFFTDPSTLARGKLALENYRPLVTLSYAIDYSIWGLNPFGYHLTNVVFHLLNGILVFLLLKRSGGDEAACFAALLFVAHPVQTEAVSWISGRSNVLFAFFYLAALLSYIKFRGRDSNISHFMRKHAGFELIFDYTKISYIASIFLFTLALLSKEAAATLPLVIILFDVITPREAIGKRALRWAPYFVILSGYLFLRFSMLDKLFQRSFWGGSVFHTYLTIPKLITTYIGMLFWPSRLCVDRQMPLVKSFMDIDFLTGIIVMAVIIAIFAASFRRSRNTAFFTSWFLVTLTPFLNIFPINILIAERFLYLPSIGVFFLISLALFKLLGGIKKIFFSTVLLVMVILTLVTANRNLQWQDELTLFKSDVLAEPRNARLHNSLGVAYLYNGEPEEAEKEFNEALAIDGEFLFNYVNLGKLYFKLGRHDEAEDIVKRGLEIDRSDPELLNIMAVIYANRGNYEGAESLLRSIIKNDPKFFEAYLNLGRLLEESGSHDEALGFYMSSLAYFRPGYEQGSLWLRIAGVYELKNMKILADELYKFVIKKYPDERVLQYIAREMLER